MKSLNVVILFVLLAFGPFSVSHLALAENGRLIIDEMKVTDRPEADEQFQTGVAAYDRGDYTAAYDAWVPLARKGNLTAQRNVGHLLRQGLGVEQNLKRAFKFYRRAARSGLVSAQANLAHMYLHGQGTRQSDKKALKWFWRAAKADNAQAQFELAQMVVAGTGTQPDLSKARQLYQAAAKQGHKQAIFALAALDTPGLTSEPGP